MLNFVVILKYKKIIVGGSVSLVILAFVLFSQYGLMKRLTLENKKSQLLHQIEKESKLRDSLLNRKYQLLTDTFEIEKLARNKYGMFKKGEEIYYLNKIK